MESKPFPAAVFFFLSTVLSVVAPPGIRSLEAGVGYGYSRAEDPLILGIKKIILEARRGGWDKAREESVRLAWLFKEFRDDLGVDIEKRFLEAVDARTLDSLSREVTRVVFYAVAQKFFWNRKEGCDRFVPAKSRVEAAQFYYEEILSIGVRDYDVKKKTELHRKVLEEFKVLAKSIGSGGLFGIGARKPDLNAFAEGSDRILGWLREVFPRTDVR